MGSICKRGKTIVVVIAAVFVFPGLVSQVATAQVGPDAGLETPVDAYGNARPLYRERRPIGLFQNDVQRRALRGYQDVGRRENRRGGEDSFALPGDFHTPLSRRGLVDPLHVGDVPFTMRKAFERYGGFGERAGRATEGDLATIIGRRQAILMATSGTAPVQRSLWQYGMGAGLADPRRDFAPPGPTDVETPPAALTLTESLNRTSMDMGRELRGGGRRHFREGAYRRAGQFFESAYTLDPTDFDSRVREIFCHLALGSTRTARVLLQALLRRHPNPFDQEVDLAAEIGPRGVVQEIRLRTSMFAQVNETDDAAALYAFTLWYLGDHEESTLVVEEIARNHPEADYAGWPAQMRAVAPTNTAPTP